MYTIGLYIIYLKEKQTSYPLIIYYFPANHNFWTIEYYQKYFDVHTNEVVERIISSVLPQKVSRNYFDERIKGKPDLYGPVWISVTLVGTHYVCFILLFIPTSNWKGQYL